MKNIIRQIYLHFSVYTFSISFQLEMSILHLVFHLYSHYPCELESIKIMRLYFTVDKNGDNTWMFIGPVSGPRMRKPTCPTPDLHSVVATMSTVLPCPARAPVQSTATHHTLAHVTNVHLLHSRHWLRTRRTR